MTGPQEPSSTYDELPYSDQAFVDAHPDRLAVVGTLHGLSPAPVGGCRVLDLGCGLGGHLIPMAAVTPESRFLGIDLSARQIELGRELIDRLVLPNIELRRQDLMDFDAAAEGPFDYIICHGVYSWVPPEVQERILAICKHGLAPSGLVTISYNAFPGWRVNSAVRDILRYGARGAGGPASQVRKALEFLEFVAKSLFEPDGPYGRAVRSAAEALPGEDPTYVFHEYLEECNNPARFEDFAGRASAVGLRYVGDAGMRDPSNLMSDMARQTLTGFAEDVIRCEQTLDFLRNRTFRRDVLCHDSQRPDRWPRPEALSEMVLLAQAEPVSAEPDTATTAVEQFRNASGQTLSTGDPGLKTALVLLHRARPRAMKYADLMAQVRSAVPGVDEGGAGGAAGAAGQGGPTLGRLLLACGTASLLELHTHLPPIGDGLSPRPTAGALARWQASAGRPVVNLLHRSLQLDDASRAVLALLDGTRDRRALCEAIGEQLQAGKLKLPPRGNGGNGGAADAKPRTVTPDELPKIIDEILHALAGLRLLVG